MTAMGPLAPLNVGQNSTNRGHSAPRQNSPAIGPSINRQTWMNATQFVGNWSDLKNELLEAFMGNGNGSGAAVAGQIEAMGLSGEQRNQMRAVVDGVLRDAMYTLLLGLDGAASIGRDQQRFTIIDEGGNVVGPIEEEAWKCFHGTTTS